jgi:hypothetical protein
MNNTTTEIEAQRAYLKDAVRRIDSSSEVGAILDTIALFVSPAFAEAWTDDESVEAITEVLDRSKGKY